MTTPNTQNDANTIVVYHAHCCDGQGAAAAFYTKHPEATYFPGAYNRELTDFTGKDVYFVDFSCRLNVLKNILEVANSVTIIDHHKTAIDELKDFEHPKFTKVFDLNHSGAVLTWKWLWPEREVPQILSLIEDRDLWRFNISGTKEINAYLYSLEFDIQQWADVFLDAESFRLCATEMIASGISLLRQDAKRVASLLRNARMMRIGGLLTPTVNCNGFHASDVGHELAKGKFFAATYYDTPRGRTFSLRASDDSTADVSAIARTYGGGGHMTAAGFTVPFDVAYNMEVRES